MPSPDPIDPLTQLNATKAELAETLERLKVAEDRVRTLVEERNAWEENPWTLLSRHLDGGLTAIELGKQVTTLCAEVQERRLKASIGLTVTIKPRGTYDLEFEPVLKTVPPKPEPADASIFFFADGKLSRKNPKQREMFED